MVAPTLQQELEQQVRQRTGRRIRDLAIEVRAEEVVLRGRAESYHLKQLAQEGIYEVLPRIRLENAIVVEAAN